MSRFEREARAAVRITSEHVARVFDVGTLETGAPYMVMEFLEGEDLAAWLAQRGPLPVEQAVDFVLQACVAVAEAHAVGIVHRDLKPANLYCTRRSDGQMGIKVLDFGISKLTQGSAAMTRTMTVVGSPLYMSPEQMRASRDADARTDIWALGVVLYELLSGHTPFAAETLPAVALRIATEAPPPLRAARPDVPAGLEAVILRCLEKDRRGRFRNVGELARALAEFAPARARTSAERVGGIVDASGLSARGPSIPSAAGAPAPFPSSVAAHLAAPGPAQAAGSANTMAASTASHDDAGVARTLAGLPRRRPLATIALVAATACVFALIVVFARRASAPSATTSATSPATAMATPAATAPAQGQAQGQGQARAQATPVAHGTSLVEAPPPVEALVPPPELAPPVGLPAPAGSSPAAPGVSLAATPHRGPRSHSPLLAASAPATTGAAAVLAATPAASAPALPHAGAPSPPPREPAPSPPAAQPKSNPLDIPLQ